MKTLIRTLRTVAILAAVAAALALPRAASAAPKVFASMAASPASTNITAGVANSVSTTVSLVDGNSGSTSVGNGSNCFYSVSISPSDPSVTASLSVTNFISVKNATQTLTILTVSTTSLTPSNTYTATIWANDNPSNSTAITPISTTFAITMVSTVFNPNIVWSPAGANTNWSTAGNWTPNGVPALLNDVDFVDLGAVPTQGTVDNVVDSSLTIGSLTYGQTNNFHTTLIPVGVTLTVGGDTNGLVAGTGTDPGPATASVGYVTYNTITGTGGALAVTNTSANVNVSESHATANPIVSQSIATLDMAGLDKFTATVARLLVGVDISLKGACGVLNLARTNTIIATAGSTAPQIDIGDNSQASGTPTIPSVLNLGQTNGIFADSIAVGRSKTDSTGASMNFNTNFVNPTAFFRGTNGASSRVGTWMIGDGFGGRTTSCFGTCDFSLGTVNALVNTMYIGKGADNSVNNANNPGTGTLTFNAGTIDVNTLEVGYSTTAGSPPTTVSGHGTVNASGGSLLVNTLLELGHGIASSGTLNISNATVTANVGVTAAGGTAAINMTGGSLNVTNGTAGIGTVASPINTFSVANSTLTLAVQSLAPSVAVSTLTVGGTANTINISSVPLLTGFPTQFPVIQYGSSSGDLTTFVLGTLPSASPIPYGAFLSNNVANNSIDIVFTSGPSVPALTWDGTPTGDWDTTTANWKPKSGPDTTYGQGNFVTFDDTLTGTPNVNLTTTLTPGSVTVNNATANYIFSGGGSISGSITLVKSGSGSLTLTETGGDNFSGGMIVNNGTVVLDNAGGAISGGTTINGGTIQVGNNDVNGAMPLGNVVDGGALIFNRANNILVNNAISGAGTLTQAGTNIVTLGGNSTFAGTATVAQGTLQVGSTNGLGSATSVTVNDGATFDVNGFALFGNGNSGLIVTVSGAGAGGNGAIVNNSTNDLARVLHTVTLAADATFGGISDWDIRNSAGKNSVADAQLNGAFNLTKTGTNTVTLTGVTIDANLNNINVQVGTLDVSGTATALITSLGNVTATATVFSNATLTLDTLGNVPGKMFVLTNGGTLKCSGTNTVSSPVRLAGAAKNTITVNSGAQFTITSAISGPGSFTKNGTNMLILTAANTYGGSTVLSGGTLQLYGGGDGSIAASTNININSGTTIDVSGRSDGTFTLTSGQTLIGGVYGTNNPPIPGIINGSLVVSAGATLAPGTSTTNVGTISVSTNVTLQGAIVMKISASGGNDQIDAAAITNGGTLVVTNFSGPLSDGQTFQLLVATNGIYNTGSFSSVTLPSAPGLTWTNNLTVNGTITAGVAGSGPAAQPHITSVSLSGTSLVIGGTNGTAGRQFYVLTTTNVALPLSQWTTNTTGTFNSGNFSITNIVNPGDPHNFYILQVP